MAKRVFDGPMVAHVWAQRNQDDGRNRYSNFYFRGDTIYSYGGHFPIARFIDLGKGKGKRSAVLFTPGTYGPTTSKHMAWVRQALPAGVPVFTVPIDATPAEVRKYYARRIADLAQAANKARTRKADLLRQCEATREEANRYAAFMGLRWRFKATEDAARVIEQAERAERKAREQREARAREAAAAEFRANQEQFQEWRAGEPVHFPYSHRPADGAALLAYRPASGMIITSKGAEVSADLARRVWPRLLAVAAAMRTGGAPIDLGGVHVGPFTLDRAEPDSVYGWILCAGCHRIPCAELQRVAVALGLPLTLDAAPAHVDTPAPAQAPAA